MQAGPHLACSGRGIAGPEETGTGGGPYRRLLHGGKKGGLAVGPTERGKGTLSPMITVFLSPLVSKALSRTKTSLNQLVEGLLGQSFLDTLPARLMGHRAYDSDRLDRDLAREDTLERDAVKNWQSRLLVKLLVAKWQTRQ